MASSTDFKKLFEKYQEEGAPNGISIVKYCQLNGIVYSHFERWYKSYKSSKAMPVEIVDKDGLSKEMQPLEPSSKISSVVSSGCLSRVELVFSNGLHVSHRNLSYQSFRNLVEKLEVLC